MRQTQLKPRTAPAVLQIARARCCNFKRRAFAQAFGSRPLGSIAVLLRPLTVKLSGARSFRRQAKALYPKLRHVVSLSGPTRATAPTIVRGRLKPAYCARAEPPTQTSAIVLNAAADTTNAAEAEDSPYRHAHLPCARLQLQAKGLRPSFWLSDFGLHNRLVASSNGEVERRAVFAAPSEGTLSRTSTRREPLRAYPRDRSNDC